jgi:hypothetical protein
MLVGLDLTLAEVLQHLESAEEALGRKVNPTCYTPQEFEQRLASPESFVHKVLSQPTIDMLRQLTGPVNVTSYATGQEDLRKMVRDFLAPYQRLKPDISLSFIDPREQPKLAQAAGVTVNGEMVVEYEMRSENINTLTEHQFANLIMRLARGAERTVMSLDGQGGRLIDGKGNHDLGLFGRQLENKGFATGPLNLSLAPAVPDDLKILIIAGPKVDLLPPEVKKIKAWIDKGGSLLWLITLQSGNGGGPTLPETAQLLAAMGLRDALNLDGGSSTGLVLAGQHLVKGRGVAGSVHNALGLVPLNRRGGSQAAAQLPE